MAPPADDPDAVRRIQKALVALGQPLPISFAKGTGGEPDGKFGNETYQAVIKFQKSAFPSDPREWDGRVGHKTLEKMDSMLPRGGGPPPPPPPPPPVEAGFVCGPDVTDQIAETWAKIQSDFRVLSRLQKITACNTILLPVKDPEGLVLDLLKDPNNTDLDGLLAKIRSHADINGWDTLPLFRGESRWLREPPVYDPAKKGPCATPTEPPPNEEKDTHCGNTVQVAGKCWLNGSVNYGTFGVMVNECSEFAAHDWGLPRASTDWRDQPLAPNLVIRTIYSLRWATTLIRGYKKFGSEVEDPAVPIAWTEATFNGGPKGTPSIAENRPKCKCSCGSKGNIVTWDYVWDPWKPRSSAKPPK